MRVYTLPQLIDRMERFPRALRDALAKGLGDALGQGEERSIAELRKTALGQHVWGPSPRGWGQLSKGRISKRVHMTGVRIENGVVISGAIEAFGLAAAIELGGKTNKHVIKPKGRGRLRVLAFEDSGESVFARRVNHPGGRVQREPYLEKGQSAALEAFGAAADPLLQAAADQVIG